MRSANKLVRWSAGFLGLNLYVHGLPKLFSFEVLHWFAYWTGFFMLAFVVARYLLTLEGLQAMALRRERGWGRQLALGFGLGAGLWGLKYLVFLFMGKFTVAGIHEPAVYLPMLAQALLAMFFAAILNDIIIRGYWWAFCQKHGRMSGFILLATLLYCLDDAWNEGFSLLNTTFSALLGFSLAYTVYKTGALWLCAGIHWGSNMVYRLMWGFDGRGVWQLEGVQESLLYEWISLGITALLFPLLYLLLQKVGTDTPDQPAAERGATRKTAAA